MNLAQLNAHNVLAGKPVIRTMPDLPKQPIETIFIPTSKLYEMVEEASRYQEKFSSILTKHNPTPILEKLNKH